MNDDLALPDFLDRKKNGIVPEKRTNQRYLPKGRGIVWPPKRDWREVEAARRAEQREYESCLGSKVVNAGLTRGEQEELAEIKAMIGTSIIHAKAMALDWVSRNVNRKIQARRRAALKSVKGL
jgi:hypothetical protein